MGKLTSCFSFGIMNGFSGKGYFGMGFVMFTLLPAMIWVVVLKLISRNGFAKWGVRF